MLGWTLAAVLTVCMRLTLTCATPLSNTCPLVKRSQNPRRRPAPPPVDELPDEMTMDQLTQAMHLHSLRANPRGRHSNQQDAEPSGARTARPSRRIHVQHEVQPQPQSARVGRSSAQSMSRATAHAMHDYQLQLDSSARNIEDGGQSSGASPGSRAIRARRSPRRTRAPPSGWQGQSFQGPQNSSSNTGPVSSPTFQAPRPAAQMPPPLTARQRLEQEVDRFNSHDYYTHEYTFARALLQNPELRNLDIGVWLRKLADNEIPALRIRQRFLNRALLALKNAREFYAQQGQQPDADHVEYAFARFLYLRHYNKIVERRRYHQLLQNFDTLALEIRTIYNFVKDTPWGSEGVTEADDEDDVAPLF